MAKSKEPDDTDYSLEFLLAFDGRVHWLEDGEWIKFEIGKVSKGRSRPHGLKYSFTLHAPDGTRLLGFDNAHSVKTLGGMRKRAVAHDHWHRTEKDKGRPYKFVSADKLLQDFFAEVERVLKERGSCAEVANVTERKTDD